MSPIWLTIVLSAGLCGPRSCLGPMGPVEKLYGGFCFTEGPASDKHGNLYFTDVKDGDGKIYKIDADGRLTLFRAGTGRANGLAVNKQGEIVACQMIGRVVAYSADGCSFRVLADRFCGRRFNAPNDLVIDHHGGIYFTDPFFGAPRLRPPQRVAAVYYLAPNGAVTRLIDNLRNPNGVLLSVDEKTLYVIPSFQREVMAYPIEAPGRLGPGRVLCWLARSWLPIYVGGDGGAIDDQGNLYIASQRGVQIFDPHGNALGIIRVPENPSNVAFGGRDRKTLFITARMSIYAVPMPIPGR